MLRRVTMPSNGASKRTCVSVCWLLAEAGLLLIELRLAVLDFLLARVEIALAHFDVRLRRAPAIRGSSGRLPSVPVWRFSAWRGAFEAGARALQLTRDCSSAGAGAGHRG